MNNLHLADYIIHNHKWYDTYSQTNRLTGTNKSSWIKKTNWWSLILFCFILIIFPSTLYTTTMYLMFLGIIFIWTANFFIFKLSRKHYDELVIEWWNVHKDNEKFWNSLDKQLIAHYKLK